MIIRRLNNEGLRAFSRFLDQAKTDPDVEAPKSLLMSADTSELLPVEIEIESRDFATRFEAAKYLNDLFAPAPPPNLERDVGLWGWLAIFYFEQLCTYKRGKRLLGERSRFLLAHDDSRRYYRHLLAGPYRIYRSHRRDPEAAMILLFQPLNVIGHFNFQLASRQEYLTNSVILSVAADLYLSGRRQKVGAVSQNNGGVFRFVSILNQLDLTWDLHSLSKTDLFALLPDEFWRFRQRQAS